MREVVKYINDRREDAKKKRMKNIIAGLLAENNVNFPVIVNNIISIRNGIPTDSAQLSW